VAELVASSMSVGSDGGKAGGAALDALLKDRVVEATSFDDWRAIEAAETAAARPGSPREKLIRHADWLKVLGR
jgi:ferredoxin--NADP+ reductase